MIVDDALINKLAHLSRLEFDEEEKDVIKTDLEKMIGFIDKLNELDTTGVAPLLHMTDNVNVFRNDAVKGEISRKDVFKNAPLHDDEFFKVPKVIKK
jgi:aspartyl-tRNA(Asn)/glutamyl-tRNA(Gln) amidotransferase subunit C